MARLSRDVERGKLSCSVVRAVVRRRLKSRAAATAPVRVAKAGHGPRVDLRVARRQVADLPDGSVFDHAAAAGDLCRSSSLSSCGSGPGTAGMSFLREGRLPRKLLWVIAQAHRDTARRISVQITMVAVSRLVSGDEALLARQGRNGTHITSWGAAPLLKAPRHVRLPYRRCRCSWRHWTRRFSAPLSRWEPPRAPDCFSRRTTCPATGPALACAGRAQTVPHASPFHNCNHSQISAPHEPGAPGSRGLNKW